MLRVSVALAELDAICVNDELAARVLFECQRRHLQGVPGKLAIAGFDDVWMWRACHPALTSVRIPYRWAGGGGADLRQLAGEEVASMEPRPGFSIAKAPEHLRRCHDRAGQACSRRCDRDRVGAPSPCAETASRRVRPVCHRVGAERGCHRAMTPRCCTQVKALIRNHCEPH